MNENQIEKKYQIENNNSKNQNRNRKPKTKIPKPRMRGYRHLLDFFSTAHYDKPKKKK